MKAVDMSPEAVTRRLKELDQIWELSVALKKAGENHRKKSNRKPEKKDDRNKQ